MGIRLKLALGFALLTVVVISSVSFWAAQSLGLSIESSDIDKLESLKTRLAQFLDLEQKSLDRTCADLATTVKNLSMLSRAPAERLRFAESVKSNLNLDWLEFFINGKPVLSDFSKQPEPGNGTLKRLADSGPYSYQGYLTSTIDLDDNTSITIAQKPDFSKPDVPMYCFFDLKGILVNHNFTGQHDFLKRLVNENISGEIKVESEFFRVRTFKLGQNSFVLTGYPAQRTIISRLDIDSLMIRLTILQVIGLLILGYFLGRRLFLPLQALGHSIEKVAEGDWKEISLNQPPMLNSGNEIESVVCSFNKMVKELKLAQSRLIEVQKELGKKEKLAALGRFSAGIAHEINNPLGTILVNAGLIKESLEKGMEVGVDEIEEIVSEVKRCKNIISTLRTYTTQTNPVLSRLNLDDAMKELTDFLRSQSEFRNLILKQSFDAEGQANIDLDAMKQVFYNLTRNALEAMSNNEVKELTIATEKASDHFSIIFRDKGSGFNCEPELIFEPLFTTKAQGTGLGLIICQAIVEGHGGKITARRKEEHTEFAIMLPFATERHKSEENHE